MVGVPNYFSAPPRHSITWVLEGPLRAYGMRRGCIDFDWIRPENAKARIELTPVINPMVEREARR
jgi:hypothetical protein